MSVTVKIGGSIAGLKGALKNAEGIVQNFGRKLKGFRIGSMLAGGITAAVAAATAMAASKFRQLVDKLDDLGKRARGFGMTAEQIQGIDEAARKSNISLEAVGGSISRVFDTVANARNGVKSAVDALAKVGVTVEELSGISSYQIFEKLVKAVSDIPDPTERASAAMDVFGKALAKNTAFFQDFQQNVDAFKASGRLISDEDVKAAEQIKDYMAEIEASWNAILIKTGAIKTVAGGMGGAREVSEGKIDPLDVVYEYTRLLVKGVTLGMVDFDKALPNTHYDALPLTRSETSFEAQKRQSAEAIADAVENGLDESEYLEAMEEMSAAVESVADTVTGKNKPTGALGRGGGDPTFTDALRRVGGDAGGIYRAGDNYAKTTAEATKAMADGIDAMQRNGITLRG